MTWLTLTALCLLVVGAALVTWAVRHDHAGDGAMLMALAGGVLVVAALLAGLVSVLVHWLG